MRLASFLAILSLFSLVLPIAARADAALEKLETGYEVAGWNGVGQLDIGGRGFCTAALISPTLVLTAAHCLHDPSTGKLVDASKLRFLAGWRNGRADAYRDVRRALAHPSYVYSDRKSAGDVNYDLALLELDSPIRLPSIQPFDVGAPPAPGATVGVVSYAQGRSEVPSYQKACQVLARRNSIVVMSCDIDFGASGAPVFQFVDGRPEIVAVVSGKAVIRGKPVSLGIAAEDPLKTLRAELKASDGSRFVRAPVPGDGGAVTGVLPTGGIRAGGMGAGGIRAGGAKFLRP
ncbi:trypsin-like serine peptidase [Acidimangrovimonas sediminis]|uniref:trypsin-like serine peptidase n=1 Tax=Acidimangrovimonas sediminis TaxID=2056283 RepID=UPI000C800324|nr:S1 family peptidase [Acidimangrovimonas sediminis]